MAAKGTGTGTAGVHKPAFDKAKRVMSHKDVDASERVAGNPGDEMELEPSAFVKRMGVEGFDVGHSLAGAMTPQMQRQIMAGLRAETPGTGSASTTTHFSIHSPAPPVTADHRERLAALQNKKASIEGTQPAEAKQRADEARASMRATVASSTVTGDDPKHDVSLVWSMV